MMIEKVSKKKLSVLALVSFLGLVILGISIFLRENRIIPEWNGEIYSMEKLNALDAAFAHPYCDEIDNSGTYAFLLAHMILCVVCFLIPGINALKKRNSLMSVFFDFVFYADCWVYTFGVYRILKTVGGRIRPYMYFPNPSLKDIAEGDFISSWPSGHTSAVFISLAFLFWWLKDKDMKPLVKKLLLSLIAVICVLTMALRILSGNHFPTDVLSGAVVGFTVAFLVCVGNEKILRSEC